MAKELVLYFSVYGTSKIVAEEIAKQTGADIREIEPVIPYDSNRDHYNALTRLAKRNTMRISARRSKTGSISRPTTASI